MVNPAAVSVAAAAKSCSEEYVTQFEDAGIVGVYGGTTGPFLHCARLVVG